MAGTGSPAPTSSHGGAEASPPSEQGKPSCAPVSAVEGVVDDFALVGVVGAGVMGCGIAESLVRAGVEVRLFDASEGALTAARSRIDHNLVRSVAKSQLTSNEAKEALEHLELVHSVQSMAAAELVIEAVPEVLDIKMSVLRTIAGVVARTAVVGSNTSSIPITRLSEALSAPERFLGLHFFNPVPRMGLAEVITTEATAAEVAERVKTFVAERLGKTPILVGDRPGFVVNHLLVPYLLSAVRMVQQGYASAEDADAGMRLGCGHPMGPLELCDLIGIDTVIHISDAIFIESGDPTFVVPALLRDMATAGRLGRKSGEGFYDYHR